MRSGRDHARVRRRPARAVEHPRMDGDMPLPADALSDWPAILRALPTRGWVTADELNGALGGGYAGQALGAKLSALRRRGMVASRSCECGKSLLWRITPAGGDYLP